MLPFIFENLRYELKRVIWHGFHFIQRQISIITILTNYLHTSFQAELTCNKSPVLDLTLANFEKSPINFCILKFHHLQHDSILYNLCQTGLLNDSIVLTTKIGQFNPNLLNINRSRNSILSVVHFFAFLYFWYSFYINELYPLSRHLDWHNLVITLHLIKELFGKCKNYRGMIYDLRIYICM